jgi:hypothetical protein
MEARYESERVLFVICRLMPCILKYYLGIILRYSATHSARAMSSDWPSQQCLSPETSIRVPPAFRLAKLHLPTAKTAVGTALFDCLPTAPAPETDTNTNTNTGPVPVRIFVNLFRSQC